MKITGKVENKVKTEKISNLGKRYFKVDFVINGEKMACFYKPELGDIKEGDNVDVEYEEQGIYKNIKSITKTSNGSLLAPRVVSTNAPSFSSPQELHFYSEPLLKDIIEQLKRIAAALERE